MRVYISRQILTAQLVIDRNLKKLINNKSTRVVPDEQINEPPKDNAEWIEIWTRIPSLQQLFKK
jgi:hypothetical protein